MPSGTSFFAVTQRKFTSALCAASLIAIAFLLTHGYTGIRHDGILYAGDALARIIPGQFHEDLYFLFGSQGRFTILPAFYGKLIEWFGLGFGTIVGLLMAGVLFLAATWTLIKAIAPERLRFYCVLSVVLGWTIYGGRRVFAYSESCLTARSFAEPAVLFALALLFRRQYLWAAVALAIAAIFHPLIAAGGLAVAWIMMLREDRRWLWLLPVAVAALVILGALGVDPFADVFARYDVKWWALVQEINVHAFITNWYPLDFGILVFDTVAIYFASRDIDDQRLRGFLWAAVIVGFCTTLASFLLVDLGRSVFFGKLQIWRALWIMQWVAMASLPLALASLWKRGDAGRVCACLLGVGWMAPFSIAPALVALLAVAIDSLRQRITITPTLTRIAIGLVIVCALVISIQYEVRAVKLGDLLNLPARSVIAQALAMNLIVLAVIGALWRFLPKLGRAGPVLTLLLLVGALFLWDQRAAWTRTMESTATGQHIWPGLIEPDAKVYWYRNLMAPWILLGHGNYYTQEQGSGAVFSRDMVMELDRRRKMTALLDFQEQICRMMNGLNAKQASCEPTVDAVKELCSESRIDYVVLQSMLESTKPLANYSTGVVENGYEKKFFLYRCSDLQHG